MAFNPYFPAYGVPYQYPQIPQYQPNMQNSTSGTVFLADWVQGGIQGMKSYPLSANQKAVLFDTESNMFGIKCVDASGMPLPLRVFDYTERNTTQNAQNVQNLADIDVSAYITRDEFEARISQFLRDLSAQDKPVQNNNVRNGDSKNGK